MHLGSPTSRPFLLHKTSKIPFWWLLFSHKTHTWGLFCHLTQQKIINLVIDYYCIKCFRKYNTEHLINTTIKTVNIIIDWNVGIFFGIQLKWEYDKKNIFISMPNCVNRDIACLYHYHQIKPQHPPNPYNVPVYGQKRQFVIPTITNKKSTPNQLKHCQ